MLSSWVTTSRRYGKNAGANDIMKAPMNITAPVAQNAEDAAALASLIFGG
jgi:hypothetical protein